MPNTRSLKLKENGFHIIWIRLFGLASLLPWLGLWVLILLEQGHETIIALPLAATIELIGAFIAAFSVLTLLLICSIFFIPVLTSVMVLKKVSVWWANINTIVCFSGSLALFVFNPFTRHYYVPRTLGNSLATIYLTTFLIYSFIYAFYFLVRFFK